MLTRIRVSSSFLGLLLFGLAGTIGFAQVGTTSSPTSIPTTTQVVEWDISNVYNGGMDAEPGAVSVDKRGENSALWFVTRALDFRVLRLQPNSATKMGGAQWTSWQLDSTTQTGTPTTGGIKRLKASDDGRLAIVRTLTSVQVVDTRNCWNTTDPTTLSVQTVCNRTEFQDANAAMISDVAVDHNQYVYTAIALAVNGQMTNQIEKLDLSTGNTTFWIVGGGAGNCVGTSDTDPCIAGIAVHPYSSNLIYYSEPDTNSIAELNVCTNTVRHWALANLSNGTVSQPRQLNIDQDGIIWIVTGSGHLVSLDPKRNIMTVHLLPDNALADPFGVAPDGGFVGYTASDSAVNKVGMLIPAGTAVYVCPTTNSVSASSGSAIIVNGQALQDCGSAPTFLKTVNIDVVNEPNDGTYVEAQIASNANPNGLSTTPLGIGSHQGKAVGTFFYAVGVATSNQQAAVDRVGFVRLPRAGFKARHERQDKDDNDDGSDQDDQAHDGIPNQNESSGTYAHMDRQNDQLAPGQSLSYALTAGSATKALVATITADSPLAPVSIEIDDPNGIVLAVPVATPGTAVATVVPTLPGNYTVRVTNAGMSTINPETDLLAREGVSLP